MLTRILSAAVLRQRRDAFAREAEELVEGLVPRGSFDAVKDRAEAYPLKVFPDALGLSPEGRGTLLSYGNIASNAFAPPSRAIRRSDGQSKSRRGKERF